MRMKVNIPCPGHAPLILNELKTINGIAVVVNILPFGIKENELLSLAASAEKNSEHHLAQAIVNAAKSRKIEVAEPKAFKTIPGYGISATVGKKRVLVGNAALMKREKVEIEDKVATAMAELEEKGETVVIVAENRKITGLIAIADTIKEHSREAIEKLNKMGYETVLITGDNERTALAIAKQVGIKRVMAHVFPEDKANEVKRLQKEGKKVVFVGDGINDAPALAQADVGIAIGAGTDVAIESGDIVLIKSDLRDIITAIQISKYTVEKIKQNLFWAFFTMQWAFQ
jgi:Cu+-exporting ATPase